MSCIIAIANHKGGVAKTTTAVNLAAGIARKGHSVLLVDLDAQANATYGLGVDLDSDQTTTIAQVFGQEKLSIENVIVDTSEPNLKLVPSDIRLVGAEKILDSRPFREMVLKKALSPLTQFSYIILDCPPSIHTITRNALVSADKILIPTELGGHALKGLGDLFDLMVEMKNGDSYDWKVLLTKVSGRGKERQALGSKFLSPIQDRILNSRIRLNEAIEESQMESEDEEPPTPVVLSKTWNVGARDYRALVKEILEIWPA